ncbi:protein hinderin isoform X2 [Cheilinus undulatus]|uniref:protein hinderin isoform X2 n=1 Tax=Cheilinus undulatus TaxID=241271 RepID=UPI001BD31CC4|nr:protein hinderin isoform X2 [Cheilinus undulatus]
MAAAATKSGNSGIFWMNGVSDDEQPLAFVPGVDGEVKTQTPFRKRDTKMPARPSSDCKNGDTLKKGGKKQGHLRSECSGVVTKEKVSVRQPATAVATEHIPSPTNGSFLSSTQVISETSRAKGLVCLKDLCPEDKRRIANLIEELARVSEEKEVSVQRLKDEQETFERKIQQLEQQNLIIAQERESLQQQYRECQELLRLYQQYLSQQQAKLNQSIAQLSQAQAHSKVLSSEEAPSRANGSRFDGSYLGFATARAQQPQVSRSSGGGKGPVQILSNAESLSSVSEFSPTDGPIKQQRSQKRQCREPQLRCEHCQDSSNVTQQRSTDDGSHLSSDPNQLESERHQSGNAISSEANEALARPQLGLKDWEEKRHQLLLQKMQLETERERLHARLAEQEERLQRQNQQLHQSRLDYSRFKQATKSDLSSSSSRHADPQLAGLSHQDLPSSVHEEPQVQPGGQSLHALDNDNEASEWSKKDMATSPVKSPVSLSKPTPVSVIQTTPEARLDFSVVELLDIFSPVSTSELNKPSTRRPKTRQRRPDLPAPKPVGRTLHTPVGPYPQHAQQDLEESQILEDIFFIC